MDCGYMISQKKSPLYLIFNDIFVLIPDNNANATKFRKS